MAYRKGLILPKRVKKLKKDYDIKLICVSMGKDGSRAYYGDCIAEVPGFIREDTIERTGAGDTFCGCILHFILKYGLDSLNEARLEGGAPVRKRGGLGYHDRKGALKVMPEAEEIERIIFN